MRKPKKNVCCLVKICPSFTMEHSVLNVLQSQMMSHFSVTFVFLCVNPFVCVNLYACVSLCVRGKGVCWLHKLCCVWQMSIIYSAVYVWQILRTCCPGKAVFFTHLSLLVFLSFSVFEMSRELNQVFVLSLRHWRGLSIWRRWVFSLCVSQ